MDGGVLPERITSEHYFALDHVQVATNPVASTRVYENGRIARRGDTIAPVAFPDVSLAVDHLLPPLVEE